MKRDNVNYLLAGVFVLAMGVVLMVVLYRVTGRTGPVDEYVVYYRNVAGLKYGTAVSFEGFKVGQIEDIVPEPASTGGMRYRVTFSVIADWRIPDDSEARVVATGLISAVTIDIAEGRSAHPLKPGSELRGREQANLFGALNDVAADFHDLSEAGLKPALLNFNQRLNEVAAEFTSLSRDEIRPLLAETRHQISEAQVLAHVNELVAKLDTSATKLQDLLGKRNLDHVASTLANLDVASGDLSALVRSIEMTRQEMHALLASLERMVDRSAPGIETSVDDLKDAVADVKSTMRVVSENIDGVMYQLDGATRNINETTRELRSNPGALLRNTPPKEEGVAP